MFSLAAGVLVVVVMSVAEGERTKAEWWKGIAECIKAMCTAYNARDLEGFKALVVEDVHRFVPGEVLRIGHNAITIPNIGVWSADLYDVRETFRDEAFAEFNITFVMYSDNITSHGKMMGLFRDDDGKVLAVNYIWNRND